MCGLFGNVAVAGREPSINDGQARRLRDQLTHRGPDGAGLWRGANAVLGHRRLAVLDPTPGGAQPMATPDGRFVLVYNGELYNDEELRAALRDRGVPAPGFRTTCDTETVLHAFATWGTGAIRRLRGMFALAVLDTERNLLTLARDPFGIKPLYFWSDAHEIVFASEPPPILAHPLVSASPNMRMVSAYLTTIRTVLGTETLFEGVHALPPGHLAQCDLNGEGPVVRLIEYGGDAAPPKFVTEDDAVAETRRRVQDSVTAHLRSDVPVCSLLSGGLDSAIVTATARTSLAGLRTYAAGAEGAGEDEDLASAARVAALLGTNHRHAAITPGFFQETWWAMVERLGVPLSTPNEVAIFAVATRLRADGCVVTLSGEGADELFGGYSEALAAARAFESSGLNGVGGGRFFLEANAWIPLGAKHEVLQPDALRAAEGDSWLLRFFDRTFDTCSREAGEGADPLEAHLRLLRTVNLTGLLQRLDTATMLASVEGRTPYADLEVAALAAALPTALKFEMEEETESGGGGGGGVATRSTMRTKTALRRAFADTLPEESLSRPKASFPLPFQEWMAEAAADAAASPFLETIVTKTALDLLRDDPSRHWRLGWPLANLALWARRWWG